MNFKNITILFLFGVVSFSCHQQNESVQTTQRKPQNPVVFAKGEKITNDNFIGTVWLNNLVEADSVNQDAVGSVTFEPGARTKWHSHPAGQIILALDGIGYYQEKGQSKVLLRKGDVIKCPPNIPHWHGASPDTPFVQVAITSRQNGPTVWLQDVKEEEYKK